MKRLQATLALASIAWLPALFAAEQAAPRRFAAPDVAAAPAVGSAGGIGQVMLALVIVLGAVFLAAMLLKKLRRVTSGGAAGIEVLSQASLGAKERVVIVRVAGNRLLLGVAAGQVTLLQTLPAEAVLPAPPQGPPPAGFADLLRRSLGR